MAYANKWNSTDQIPSRAITSGEIDLYGALDHSDGGDSSRFSLSGRWAQTDESGSSKANIYLVKSSLDLWNNFTYFLTDPVNGDQFHQHDDRILGSINASHTFNSRFAGLPMETEIGVQSREDDIRLDLNDAVQRQFLAPIRSDAVQEGSIGVFAQNTLHWTDCCEPPPAGAAIFTKRRSIRFSRRPIPAIPAPSSAVRSSASCSVRLPGQNSSSTPARDFTATTRAARRSRNHLLTARRCRHRRCWSGRSGPKSGCGPN
jgi:hypothetical protein